MVRPPRLHFLRNKKNRQPNVPLPFLFEIDTDDDDDGDAKCEMRDAVYDYAFFRSMIPDSKYDHASG
jgi:hypothetical protein